MSGSEAFDVGGGEQDRPPRLDAARARLAAGDARRGRVLAAAGLGADYWKSPGVRRSWGSLGEVINLSPVRRRHTVDDHPPERDPNDPDRASSVEGAVGSLGEDVTPDDPDGAEVADRVDGAAATDSAVMPLSGPAAGWVRSEWLRAPLRPEVRALMTLPPGPELLAALQQVGTGPVCPMDHRTRGPSSERDTVNTSQRETNGDDGADHSTKPGGGAVGAAYVHTDPESGPSGTAQEDDDAAHHDESDAGSSRAARVPGRTSGWPCGCQLVVAAGWEAMTAWVGMRGADALVAAAGRQPVKAVPPRMARATVTDPGRNEVAAVLALSPASTDTRLKAARRLAAHPELAALARDGVLFTPGIRVILEETANLSPPAQSAVIARACERVRARRTEGRRPWTPGELRVAVKRMVLRLAADELADARAKARRRRRVSVTPDVDGMAWLSALISDVDAHRIHHRLSAAAAADTADAKAKANGAAAEAKASSAAVDTDNPAGGDDRCMDERRADLLVEALLNCRSRNTATHGPDLADHSDAGVTSGPENADIDVNADLHSGAEADVEAAGQGGDRPPGSGCGARGSTGPVPRGQRPEIHVVVSLDTLLGLADDPAHVHGMGPIPPEVARELAADGRWRLLVTDPASGQVAAISARTYTPSAGLARLIRAREPVCRMPGCARQAVNCDLDHTVPWPQPPGTTESNLGPLCRRCHNLKTHHGFDLHTRGNDSDGTDLPSADTEATDPAADGPTDSGAGTSDATDTRQPSSGWTWTFPSGLTHTDQPDPPLPDD